MKPDKFTDIEIAQAADASRDQNPYASPQTEGRLVAKYDPHAPVGIWRLGNALLMHADATLPERCILTNAKCDETERRVYLINSLRLHGVLSTMLVLLWGGGGIAMLAFGGQRLWLYGAIAVGMASLFAWSLWKKRPDTNPIGYSYSHPPRCRRLLWRATGALLFCLGLGCFPLIIPAQNYFPLFLVFLAGGPLLMLVGAILFAAFGFPLRFEKHFGPYFLIHGCGSPFVLTFPESDLVPSQSGVISHSALTASSAVRK